MNVFLKIIVVSCEFTNVLEVQQLSLIISNSSHPTCYTNLIALDIFVAKTVSYVSK